LVCCEPLLQSFLLLPELGRPGRWNEVQRLPCARFWVVDSGFEHRHLAAIVRMSPAFLPINYAFESGPCKRPIGHVELTVPAFFRHTSQELIAILALKFTRVD
jgi:hypothetical protein